MLGFLSADRRRYLLCSSFSRVIVYQMWCIVSKMFVFADSSLSAQDMEVAENLDWHTLRRLVWLFALDVINSYFGRVSFYFRQMRIYELWFAIETHINGSKNPFSFSKNLGELFYKNMNPFSKISLKSFGKVIWTKNYIPTRDIF